MLRIVSAAALVVLVASGCGSARPHDAAARLPRALAREWASQASSVARAAAAGSSCRALRLASSLRDEVIAAETRIPARLQKPLVGGVNALADRLTCITPPQTVTVAPSPSENDGKPPHEPPGHHKPPGRHGPHGKKR